MKHQTMEATFGELLDEPSCEFDQQLVASFKPDEKLSYQLCTPTKANEQTAPGTLIYLSPKPGARLPQAWESVLNEHNLIWVGAEQAGNEVHVARRVGLALLASAIVARTAKVDPSRTFLAGFSGGGRVASMMMPAYPHQFAGAIFICGANPLLGVDQNTVDGLSPRPMVFLTGTGDFNLEDTQMAHNTFLQAGIPQARLMVVDGLGHELPSAKDVDVALSLLSTAGEGT